MDQCSCVRIGGDHIHIDSLRNALINHFQSIANASNSTKKGQDQIEPNFKHRVNIVNKYFSVNICFESISIESEPCNENPSINEDAILLVFPTDYNNNKTDNIIETLLTPLHQHALAINQCGDLLRLCIAVTNSNNEPARNLSIAEKEERYSRRVLWCLDRGYEYIEADLSPHGLTSGFDEREKDGFARIIEAIQGTVWSTALMHKHTREKQSYTDSKVNSTTQSNTSQLKTLDFSPIVDRDNQEENRVLNSIINEEIDQQSEIQERKECFEPNCIQEESTKLQSQHQMKKEEFMFDHLEAVMRDATRIRQDAKDKKLSDEDRRKRAAETAIKLMGLLDLDNDDDDDDDESNEENHAN